VAGRVTGQQGIDGAAGPRPAQRLEQPGNDVGVVEGGVVGGTDGVAGPRSAASSEATSEGSSRGAWLAARWRGR
jgi:hypothetical protein